MTEEIDQIEERLTLCSQDMVALDDQISTYLDNEVLITFVSPPTPKPTEDCFVKVLTLPPIKISRDAGLLANELRTCLEALAQALAGRNAKTNGKFPIYQNEADFDDPRKGGARLRKFRADDQAKILSRRNDLIGTGSLARLAKLDNERKHMKLSTSRANKALVQNPLFAASNTSAVLKNCDVNGHIIERAEIFAPNFGKSVGKAVRITCGFPPSLPLSVSMDVTFDKPTQMEGRSVSETMNALVDSTWSMFNLMRF